MGRNTPVLDIIERLAAERDAAVARAESVEAGCKRGQSPNGTQFCAEAVDAINRETTLKFELELANSTMSLLVDERAEIRTQARADALEEVCDLLAEWFDIENWAKGQRNFSELLKEVRALKEKTP